MVSVLRFLELVREPGEEGLALGLEESLKMGWLDVARIRHRKHWEFLGWLGQMKTKEKIHRLLFSLLTECLVLPKAIPNLTRSSRVKANQIPGITRRGPVVSTTKESTKKPKPKARNKSQEKTAKVYSQGWKKA